MRAWIAGLAIALYAAPNPTAAQVNVKNGNFYVTYSDLEVDGFAIERTYNSKDASSTVFGVGWGTAFATRLVPLGDGAVIVKYWGGGSTESFSAPFVDEPRIGDAVRQIVEGRRKMGWAGSPDSIAAFRVALRQNLELRSRWWQKLLDSGHVKLAQYLVGSRWTASDGPSRVERTPTGYHVVESSLGTLDFDESGHLTSLQDKEGKTTIAYDAQRRIASLRAPNGVEFRFTLNPRGFVHRIDATGKDGARYAATYVVDDRNDLREMFDQSGEKFHYALDDAHNLTRIDFTDGTWRAVSYDPSSFYATRVTSRDGSWIDYEYYGDGDLYGTRLTQRDSVTVKRRAHYEWEIRTAEDGRRYSWRLLTEEKGTLTETFYDEAGRRVKVRRKTAEGETVTLYDKQGRVIKR